MQADHERMTSLADMGFLAKVRLPGINFEFVLSRT
jgi:hypothetical protein